MDTVFAPSAYPFRWQGREYRIGECGILDGTPYANVTPEDPSLVEEIERRIARNNALTLYFGAGFTRFPDDK